MVEKRARKIGDISNQVPPPALEGPEDADLRLVLPAAAGTVRADIHGGAADINIVVPEGVAASITKSSALSSVDIDDRRFPRSGDVYESPGYASAENRIELHISVGAADVSVR